MGVHSSVISGKKQVEDVGRNEMVTCPLIVVTCLNTWDDVLAQSSSVLLV